MIWRAYIYCGGILSVTFIDTMIVLGEKTGKFCYKIVTGFLDHGP
jgi:hypothetical protein